MLQDNLFMQVTYQRLRYLNQSVPKMIRLLPRQMQVRQMHLHQMKQLLKMIRLKQTTTPILEDYQVPNSTLKAKQHNRMRQILHNRVTGVLDWHQLLVQTIYTKTKAKRVYYYHQPLQMVLYSPIHLQSLFSTPRLMMVQN